MVAELLEINVDKLRSVINENSEVLEALWEQLLPGALLLLFN